MREPSIHPGGSREGEYQFIALAAADVVRATGLVQNSVVLDGGFAFGAVADADVTTRMNGRSLLTLSSWRVLYLME